MNYVLIMTEGSTELAFVKVLQEKNILKFDKESLLMEKLYHSRQIDGEIMGYIQILNCNDKVIIYRVGDNLKDKLKIPKAILSEKIADVVDISTTPEFEILFILNENLYDDYLKVKSNTKPCSFYKSHNKQYNKQYSFVYDYFSKMNASQIIDLINLYVEKRGKTLSTHQKSIKELIKSKN